MASFLYTAALIRKEKRKESMRKCAGRNLIGEMSEATPLDAFPLETVWQVWWYCEIKHAASALPIQIIAATRKRLLPSKEKKTVIARTYS